MPYEVLEQREIGERREFAFRLKQQMKGCRFNVVYLYHGDNTNPDIDWHVIGYASEQDYRADKQNEFKGGLPESQSCWLVTR